MTDSIPDEIMREAHHIRDELCIDCECKFDAGCGCLEAISRALMARDQRAAEIARRKIVSGIYAGIAEWPDGEDIADAILTYDEAQK